MKQPQRVYNVTRQWNWVSVIAFSIAITPYLDTFHAVNVSFEEYKRPLNLPLELSQFVLRKDVIKIDYDNLK